MIDNLRSTAALTERHAEQLQRRAVDAGEIYVLGHLQGVVDALGQFGHLGDQRVQPPCQVGKAAGRQQIGVRRAFATRSYMRGSSSSSSSS